MWLQSTTEASSAISPAHSASPSPSPYLLALPGAGAAELHLEAVTRKLLSSGRPASGVLNAGGASDRELAGDSAMAPAALEHSQAKEAALDHSLLVEASLDAAQLGALRMLSAALLAPVKQLHTNGGRASAMHASASASRWPAVPARTHENDRHHLHHQRNHHHHLHCRHVLIYYPSIPSPAQVLSALQRAYDRSPRCAIGLILRPVVDQGRLQSVHPPLCLHCLEDAASAGVLEPLEMKLSLLHRLLRCVGQLLALDGVVSVRGASAMGTPMHGLCYRPAISQRRGTVEEESSEANESGEEEEDDGW